ncbi:PorP/SprF family type IX secretion system membrane protein [Bacteroidota bacterium]
MNKYTNLLGFRLSILINILIVFLLSFRLSAQDIHFSQFYASPLSLNPANTGFYKGELRLADIYRTQWFTMPIPYTTNVFSLDKSIYLRKQRFGIGLLVLNDKSGDAELAISKVLLSISYHKIVRQSHFHFGLQGGVVNKAFSLKALTFPDQYNKLTGYYDPTFPTGDASSGTSITYPDINAGFSWNSRYGKFSPQAGISIYHLNQPGETFFGTGNQLTIRKSYYAMLGIDINPTYQLRPAVLLTEHTFASELVGGVDLLVAVNDNKSGIEQFVIGIYSRNGILQNFDAVILHSGITLRYMDLGLSYDLNLSDLSTATRNQGAIEFSIVFKKISKLAFQKVIPCERY